MSVTALLAIVCIIVAFVGEIIGEKVLMGTLEWFVAAIAFNTLSVTYTFGRKQP